MDLFNRKKIKELEKTIDLMQRNISALRMNNVDGRLNKLEARREIMLESGTSGVKIPEDSILWHIVGDLNALYDYLHIEAKVVYVEDEYYKALHPVPRVKTIKIVKKGEDRKQK